MDLTRFDVKAAADAGATLRLKHPATGEPLGTDDEPVTVTVIGRDSPRVREAARALEKRKAQGDAITQEDEGIALLCASVVGWSGISFDGEPLEFNPANARKLFSDTRTDWVAEQVAPFALSRRNFARNMSGN